MASRRPRAEAGAEGAHAPLPDGIEPDSGERSVRSDTIETAHRPNSPCSRLPKGRPAHSRGGRRSTCERLNTRCLARRARARRRPSPHGPSWSPRHLRIEAEKQKAKRNRVRRLFREGERERERRARRNGLEPQSRLSRTYSRDSDKGHGLFMYIYASNACVREPKKERSRGGRGGGRLDKAPPT